MSWQFSTPDVSVQSDAKGLHVDLSPRVGRVGAFPFMSPPFVGQAAQPAAVPPPQEDRTMEFVTWAAIGLVAIIALPAVLRIAVR